MHNLKSEILKIKNKTRFVLFFYFIFFLFFGQNLLADNNKAIPLLKSSHKKEVSIQKTLSGINNDIDSIISNEDLDIENPYFIPYEILVYLQTNSFDNRFSLLKESLNSTQYNLPLFLQYHAIKIP